MRTRGQPVGLPTGAIRNATMILFIAHGWRRKRVPEHKSTFFTATTLPMAVDSVCRVCARANRKAPAPVSSAPTSASHRRPTPREAKQHHKEWQRLQSRALRSGIGRALVCFSRGGKCSLRCWKSCHDKSWTTTYGSN